VPLKQTPNTIETRLGLLILLVLIIVGAGVLYRQFDFNPAVIALQAPGTAPSGKAGKAAEQLLPIPDSFEPMTPPEAFDPQNLFEKINGQADLYLSSGFVRLKTQRFVEKNNAALWLELFVYDMGAGLNAFSVYSQQYRESSRQVPLGNFAYQIENALFMVHGQYYIEIIASEASPTLDYTLQFLAERFVENHSLDLKQVQGFDWFPGEDMDKNSIRMIMANAFGFDRLERAFTADYPLVDTPVTAFVSRRKNAGQAAELAHAFYQFLLMFDGKDLKTDLPIDAVKVVEIMGTFEIIFFQGSFLAGIHEAPNMEAARALAIRLNQKLQEVERDR